MWWSEGGLFARLREDIDGGFEGHEEWGKGLLALAFDSFVARVGWPSGGVGAITYRLGGWECIYQGVVSKNGGKAVQILQSCIFVLYVKTFST